MFRKTLLRQCQAAKPAASIRSISSSPLSRQLPSTPQFAKPLAPRLFQRYASTEANGGKADQKSAGENGAEGELSESEALKKELEGKKKEVIDMKDKYLRSVADYRNLQERTRREIDSARAFAIQKFGADLIESVDNFDRALGVVPSEKLADGPEANKDLIDLHSGLKMTENIFMNTLKKHGLERFNPSELVEGKPQKFDPQRHEATFQTPVPTMEDGDIMDTQSKGFILNGRVLRAAKVGVVKNP